jgi:hypothetical protein
MLKKCLLPACALAMSLGWALPAAAADTVLFDSDGGGDSFIQITSLDWNAGNAYAEGVSASSPAGTTFQLYYQANLSVANNGSTPVFSSVGCGGADANCISLVIGFQEQILTNTFDPVNNTGTITFGFVSGGDNFFAMYANNTLGDNLSGACFVCGTQIMSGSILGSNYSSNFSGLTSPTTVQALDQAAPTNNYLGIQTIVGSGSVHLEASVGTYDTNYFQGLGGSIINFAFGDTNTNLPFTAADPSACFFATTSTGGLTPICGGTGVFGVSPFIGVGSVGAINGVSTSNLMFQADATNSFQTTPAAVPEPATLTLVGLGLIGATRMRRKANKGKK